MLSTRKLNTRVSTCQVEIAEELNCIVICTFSVKILDSHLVLCSNGKFALVPCLIYGKNVIAYPLSPVWSHNIKK